jgi:ABC-type uncharacterized transport system ATPase subunit
MAARWRKARAAQVEGLSLAGEPPFGTDLEAIGFEARAGEILGIAGVAGNGQAELLTALSGERLAASLTRSSSTASRSAGSAPARAARWASPACPRSATAMPPCRISRSPTTAC